MSKTGSIHTGHRERLKDRFRAEGLDNFDDINVLELLLFYCIAQKDTNTIAHSLIETFGSLKNVLEAEPEELKTVEGIGDQAATFLNMVRDVSRRYVDQCSEPGKYMQTLNDCGDYIKKFFVGRTKETVYLLCLDAKRTMICCKKIGEGSVNSANVPIQHVVKAALNAGATSVVLAHNHPSGIAYPSPEDIQTTFRVAKALEAVDIILADHMVVAGNDFISMAQSGYYRIGGNG